MTAEQRLGRVFGEAVLTLDERYDGYRADTAQSLQQVLRAQNDSANTAAREQAVGKIIEALGERLRDSMAGQ